MRNKINLVHIYQHHKADFEMEPTVKAEEQMTRWAMEEKMRKAGFNWKQSMERLPEGLMPTRGERVSFSGS